MFTSAFSRLLFFTPRRPFITYIIGILTVVVALLLRLVILPFSPLAASIYLFLYISIIISSLIGGFSSGIFSLILSSLYLFYMVTIDRSGNFQDHLEIQFALFVLTSLSTSYLLSAIKNAYHFSVSVLDNLYAFVALINPQGVFIDVNQSALDTFGVSRYFLVGKSLFDKFPWKYPLSSHQQLEEALVEANQGRATRFDFKVVFSSQDIAYFDCSFSPLFDSQGEVVSIVMSAIDVTSRVQAERNVVRLNTSLEQKLAERKKMEQALLVSELRFKRLVDSNLIGVVISRLDGQLVEANEAFTSMIGYTQAEVTSDQLSWHKITPVESQAQDQEIMAQLMATGEAQPMEKEFIRKDGTRFPVLVGTALLEGSHDTSITFIVDITAQKKLERRKDEFIGLASHELKTPLTSIKAFTQLLERKLSAQSEDSSLQYVSKINQQIRRLSSLVEELLDISTMEAGKLTLNLEQVDFNALVKSCVGDMQAILPHHTLLLQGRVQAKTAVDAYRLEQVIMNLITNAVKYSPNADKVVVSLSETDRNVRVSVTDFGIGIPEAQQAKVFRKFFRAQGKNRHSFPGLGLGLYLSKHIIDRHAGKIWLTSQESQGSTFSFSLPKS